MSATGRRWAGWVAFAGWLMVVIAAIDFFEGLIAAIRGEYYLFGANQIIVFDMRTWGWLTMIWAIIVGLAGLGLLSGASWARWFTIVIGSINFIHQLAFAGNAAYPLWALTSLVLTGIVLYALIVRWGPAEDELIREGM
jgi:hypothetical protein